MVITGSKNMNQLSRKLNMESKKDDIRSEVVLTVMEEIAFQPGYPHMITMTVANSFGDIMRFLCSRIGRKQSC